MANKKQYTPLFFLLKRNAFLGLLNFLVMFVSLPFFGFIHMASSKADLPFLIKPEQVLMRAVNAGGFIFNAEIMCILFGGLGFLSAMVLFLHLFSRKGAMLEASLPLTRQRDYCVRLLCAVGLLLVPLVLAILLFLASIAINGLWAYVLPQMLVPKFICLVMITLYGFALGVLSATLAGQFWSVLVVGGSIAFSLEIALMLTGALAQYYLRTIPNEPFLPAIKLYSPVMTLYKGWVSPITFIWLPGFLAILAFFCLGYWLYFIRKTEAAGNILAFTPLKGWLEGILSVIGALLLGYLFVNIFAMEIGLFVGLLLGTILTYLMCRILFSLSFSKLFAQWPVALISLGIVLIGWGCVRQDVFHYDRFLPELDALTSISFKIESDQGSEMLAFSSDETFPGALSWARTMRDASTSLPKGFSADHSQYSYNCEVEYDLNGKKVVRLFTKDNKAASLPAILTLLETEDFLHSYQEDATSTALSDLSLDLYANFTNQLSEVDSLERFGLSDFNSLFNRMSEEQLKACLDAYWQDVSLRTAEQWQSRELFSLTISGSLYGPIPYQFSYYYHNFPVFASDVHFLRACFGDHVQAVIDYASSGFALQEGVKMVYQTYAEPMEKYFDSEIFPLTSELITDPQAIVSLLENAIYERSQRFYSKPYNLNARIFFFSEATMLQQGLDPNSVDYTTLPQSEPYLFNRLFYVCE